MADDETVQVLIRVPSYQKSEWKEHADRLGMGQGEFVRTMVQAGRRGFETVDSSDSERSPAEGDESDSDPWGQGLETRVRTVLRDRGVLSWDELVAELVGDFEDELEDAVEELQSEDVVRYSGRDGGYVLIDDGE